MTGTTPSSNGELKAKPQQTKIQWKEYILYITIGVLAVALLVTCTLLVFVFRRSVEDESSTDFNPCVLRSFRTREGGSEGGEGRRGRGREGGGGGCEGGRDQNMFCSAT